MLRALDLLLNPVVQVILFDAPHLGSSTFTGGKGVTMTQDVEPAVLR